MYLGILATGKFTWSVCSTDWCSSNLRVTLFFVKF